MRPTTFSIHRPKPKAPLDTIVAAILVRVQALLSAAPAKDRLRLLSGLGMKLGGIVATGIVDRNAARDALLALNDLPPNPHELILKALKAGERFQASAAAVLIELGGTRANQRKAAPEAKPRPVAPKGPSEFQIHVAVVHALKTRCAPGVYWFHPANGEYRTPRTAAKLKAMGVRAGTPDLVLCVAGRFTTVELKAARGRLSEAQIAAHAEIKGAGGSVVVANSIKEAIAALENMGALEAANGHTPPQHPAIP